MKNFSDFLNEGLYDSTSDKIGNDRLELKEDLLNAIEESIGSSDLIDFQNWIGKFEKNDPNTIIDSLSDDSNLYDFYLKHQDDIDSILSENNWFSNKMSSLNLSSLYDVIINGSKEAINLTVLEIKKYLF